MGIWGEEMMEEEIRNKGDLRGQSSSTTPIPRPQAINWHTLHLQSQPLTAPISLHAPSQALTSFFKQAQLLHILHRSLIFSA